MKPFTHEPAPNAAAGNHSNKQEGRWDLNLLFEFNQGLGMRSTGSVTLKIRRLIFIHFNILFILQTVHLSHHILIFTFSDYFHELHTGNLNLCHGYVELCCWTLCYGQCSTDRVGYFVPHLKSPFVTSASVSRALIMKWKIVIRSITLQWIPALGLLFFFLHFRI